MDTRDGVTITDVSSGSTGTSWIVTRLRRAPISTFTSTCDVGELWIRLSFMLRFTRGCRDSRFPWMETASVMTSLTFSTRVQGPVMVVRGGECAISYTSNPTAGSPVTTARMGTSLDAVLSREIGRAHV